MTKSNATGRPAYVPETLKDIRPDRHELFLRYYSEDGSPSQWNIRRSAIRAGFTQATARSAGQSVLQAALKREARQLAAVGDTMTAKLGFSKEQILAELRKVIVQDKDFRVKLRALERLAQEWGVDVSEQKNGLTARDIFSIHVVAPPNFEQSINTENRALLLDRQMLESQNMAQNRGIPFTK